MHRAGLLEGAPAAACLCSQDACLIWLSAVRINQRHGSACPVFQKHLREVHKRTIMPKSAPSTWM